ncbi:valine--tRNA ligase [Marinivivus vitaminiproducens]|uniref:valine--tRNA ligase n=1 Tax=Marinivivus vitaminiproducens TaxID=3035935 RepID=UPI00279DC69D|nr:valine--tRNA ligase [Geminicoccaceae bacterium SCSIO 64248]
MLDKTYNAASVEARLYRSWEEGGLFRPAGDPAKPAFCLMMPPPNVTGSLHMGHALTFTIQDTLVRYHRMLDEPVLWQPGMDHAGIATQMVVERQMAAEGHNQSRRELGREKFVERVWAWKEQSGGAIVGQLRRLGASPDWSRERFTMDEGLSLAVREAFVSLHRKGLIYRDKRLVNWDVALVTAVSDLECVPTETDGHLWHIAYPIEGEEGRTITVATTRPETMLGDTGIAVHPEDERFADLVGRHAILPLVGRRIPIIADPYSDPEKGTGAVKITPAHDFNDFEVGRRHDLPAINVLTPDGRINDEAPEAYRGLDRFEARKRVVADLEAGGQLVTVEPHRHMVPHGDRSNTPIEPFLTDQWYCDAHTLAQPAIRAVETGQTVFVPRQWENTFFEWMRNIQPWCISRQLWWGHRIPAWHAPDGSIFVERTEEEAYTAARAALGDDVRLEQDPDVLDTWFSSGLWPFSTLGWPERTPDLERFYPTSVLVTGFDIIFFWVARMMMMGHEFTGEAPFREVVMHGLVRDEAGQKMSKSKGNVIDPLELVDSFGADALRFAILASTAQGRDIKFGPARVQGYRNFVTKLWNAARFCELQGAVYDPAFDPASCVLPVNRWITGELAEAGRAVGGALAAYRFNEASLAAYHFTWDLFCDWYLELAKPMLADEASADETRRTAGWVLARLLHLLQPMIPFVTEEIWQRLFDAPDGPLITARWPDFDDRGEPEIKAEIDWLIRVVGDIRAARSEAGVPAASKLELRVFEASGPALVRLERHDEAIRRLARLENITPAVGTVPGGSLQVVVDEATYVLPLAGVIDLGEEQARLRREIGKIEAELAKIGKKLGNAQFLERAPAEVVDEQRARQSEHEQARGKLEAALARIGG